MKTIACATFLALFVLSVAIPGITSAQSGRPTAHGAYHFVLEDDLTKSVEFNASTDERGGTTGQMTFSDQARIVEQDVDGTGEPRDEVPAEFFLTASLDSLTIENNRAVMGGTITDSSRHNYIGRWVQLVVEDGGERPDQVNWRLCQVQPGGWVPADSEDPRDEGAWWHWWATDFERRADVGIPSLNVIPGTTRGCPAVSLSSYDFTEVRGEGQIQVVP